MFTTAAVMSAMLATVAPASLVPDPAPRRLSEQQVEQVLADAASRREAAERAVPAGKSQIHGEVGVSVGTDGYRAAYGTAVVPLGGDSVAIVSMSTETSREWRGGKFGDDRDPRRGAFPR